MADWNGGTGREGTMFWLIWNQQIGFPTKAHELETTEIHARAEGERLARKHPGERFFLMKLVASVKTIAPPEPPVEWSGEE